MLKRIWVIGGVSILLWTCLSFDYQTKKKNNAVSLMWYNVENLFDTLNDLSKNDDDFTPSGKLNWNSFKYQSKINNIARVIKSQSKELPDFLGFCEIENKRVLEDLFKTVSPLNDYIIVHYDSPDERGIDVGFAFNKKRWVLLNSKPISVHFNSQPDDKTRDLLYVQSKSIDNLDTINFMLVHFPSKQGGTMVSQAKRIQAAEICSQSMKSVGVDKHWIVMGDFNDQPWDVSLSKSLNAHSLNSKQETHLYNLMWNSNKGLGSYNYQGKWEKLDQFIVSNSLINKYLINKNSNSVSLYKPDWLLKQTKKGKLVPFRNYEGTEWKNGFSDHLPIVLKLN
jgi:predicted extracellular nuclease